MDTLTCKQDPLNILELFDVHYNSHESIGSFYNRCRCLVASNLRKKGDKVGDDFILEDEFISSTFEDLIILWCLEKVDPCLPKKVKENFGDQIINGQTVKNLVNKISEYFSKNDIFDVKDLNNANDNGSVKDEVENRQNNVEFKPESCELVVTELKTELDDLEPSAAIVENGDYDIDDPNYSDYNVFDDITKAFDIDTKDETYTKRRKSKRTNICSLCGKGFKIKKNLDRHIYLHAHPEERKNGLKRKNGGKLSVICDECGKTLSSQRRLREHIKNKHDQNKTYKCKECDKVFKNQTEYKSHNAIVHKQKKGPEMCPECGKMIHFSSLKRHRLIHMSSHRCDQCGTRCVSQEALEAHIKKHQEDPNYCKKRLRTIQCDTCKRNFFDVVEYGSHVCKHFACDLCDMKFVVERNLKKHKRIHAGETFFTCDMCEALYTKRKELQRHMRNAHDPSQRKYKCDVCGKCYLTKSILERHKGTHTLIKPYKCDRCGKAFQQKSSLEVHMMSHTGEKPFPCVGCDQRFRSLQEMKRHRELNRCRGFKAEDLTKAES